MDQKLSKSELSRGNSDHFVYHTNFGGNSVEISAEISAEWVAGGMGGWLGRKTWHFFRFLARRKRPRQKPKKLI